MKIKQGASLQGLKISMRKALITADYVYRKFGKELVVTSGTDGEHSAGSLHYYGFAVDIRTNYFTQDEIKQVINELRNLLQSDYNVIEHKTHIHIEYEKAKTRQEGIISGIIKLPDY